MDYSETKNLQGDDAEVRAIEISTEGQRRLSRNECDNLKAAIAADRKASLSVGKGEEAGIKHPGGGNYQIVHVREKRGNLRKSIPVMSPCFALVCAVLNIIPGLGTFVSTTSICCGAETEQPEKKKAIGYNLAAGFFQLVLSPVILIGWIWSLKWAYHFIKLSRDGATTKQMEDAKSEERQAQR